jgi:hypothetical protein
MYLYRLIVYISHLFCFSLLLLQGVVLPKIYIVEANLFQTGTKITKEMGLIETHLENKKACE